MTEIREIYQLWQTKDLAQVINNLNFVLQRIADRLDKIEGLRGSARDASIPPTAISSGTMTDVLVLITDSDTVIHQVGNE